jgi:GR25 family glycosyltransferase involved in LPS biosynthesis
MIKVFVITLEHAKERQEYVSSVFKNLGIEFEFLFGIDGRKLSPEEKKEVYDHELAKKRKHELQDGEIGCSASHRLLYRTIVKRNIERVLVFEDDVVIDPELFTLLPCLEKLPIKGYMIKFDKIAYRQKGDNNKKIGRFTPWHRIKFNDKYFAGQPLVNPTLTWCYYIDIKAASAMARILPKIFLIPDAWSYFRNYVKVRCVNKVLVTNNDQLPSIIASVKDRKKFGFFGTIFKMFSKFILLIRLIFH